ncbi:MAG: ATP-binding protein [Hyphomicrobium sp.]
MHEFHRQLPLVKADATTVRQILFNLLSNAIKFTPKGGDVRVVTGLGFDRSVFVAVQDTGVGMSAEAIAAAHAAEVPAAPQRKEGRRSWHRAAARTQPRTVERRAARDRQPGGRGHGGGADLSSRPRRCAPPAATPVSN